MPSKEVIISADPVETRNSVDLYSVVAGPVTFLVPGSNSGWKLDDAPQSGVPTLLKFSNQDNTSLIVINTTDGDMYWYVSGMGGRFDEIQMRIKQSGGIFVADRSVLRTAYGDAADVPWYVLQSIALIPPPPTATPTATSTPGSTSTAVASGATVVP